MASSLRCAACAGLVIFASASSAQAFCRTTTVPIPASFSPTKGCFTDGLVLYWKNECVSYSIQQAASEQIPLATAKPIIDRAFATWTATTCAGGKVGIEVSPTDDVECGDVKYAQNGPNQNVVF